MSRENVKQRVKLITKNYVNIKGTTVFIFFYLFLLKFSKIECLFLFELNLLIILFLNVIYDSDDELVNRLSVQTVNKVIIKVDVSI